MTMSEKLAYIDYARCIVPELVIPTHHENHINFCEIPSRECAIAAAKALIDHYNIKQEELYPQQWIACSDRMPEGYTPVITRNDLGAVLEGVYMTKTKSWIDGGGDELTPTHWHPIPTL